jgi:hypothetical protein
MDIRYVRLGTRDLAMADRFVRGIVGLEFAREDHGARHDPSDNRDRTLACVDDVMRTWYLEDAARLELAVRSAGLEASSKVLTAHECSQRATAAGGIFERMGQFMTAGDPRRRAALEPTTRPVVACSALDPEPDLQRHLVVRDLAVDDVATRFDDLEPIEVAHGLGGGLDGVAGGVVGAGRRRANDLQELVDVVRHADSSWWLNRSRSVHAESEVH